MTTTGLALQAVSLTFAGKTAPFFNDLSIVFAAGQLHCIQGKNGVGKSTFFRLLQGHIAKGEKVGGIITVGDDRAVLVDGQSSADVLSGHVAMVQQKFDTMLADAFTVEENLQFASLPALPSLRSLPTAKILFDVLKHFAIDPATPMRLLSGGQRQMVAILMALQKSKNILLLDEPTAALDDANARMVMAFIKELVAATGVTALMISHDTELVQEYAQGMYRLTVDAATAKRSLLKN